ncbi:MAG: hypothetical protein MJ213_01725 [Bacilli bacterium]|nr:hypothetical protein [Bacilli bacterium]
MKKLGLLLMPLMAISLLASCSKPTPSPVTTYTLTFNCIDCKAYDESKNEITSVEIIPSPSYTTYAKFYLEGKEGRKPLKSLVNVKKTNANEDVDYEYNTITGELFIPVIDNLTITAVGTIKTLEECSWSEINEISTSGLADKYFTLGEEKKVQLKHQSGNIYQTVRIIGFNQDYTELPKGGGNPDPNKVIGITFEFVNSICDDQGYSIATQWDDTDAEKGSNYNFLDSSVRKALTKTGNGHILWAKKGATSWSNEPGGLYTDKSVLEMLPDELTEEGILKTPAKYINIWNKNLEPEEGWEEQVVNDKLFLLSPAEMGRIGHEQEEPHTVTYSLYEGHSK